MCNKFRANNFTNKGLKVRSDSRHTLLEELGESFAEGNELCDALSPFFDLQSIVIIDVHTHRNLHGVNDLLGLLFVKSDGLNFIFLIFSQIVASSVAQVHYASINSIVIDNFGQLGEVPSEPLLQSHGEGVDVLVHLLNQGNGLRDWLVSSVHILSTS